MTFTKHLFSSPLRTLLLLLRFNQNVEIPQIDEYSSAKPDVGKLSSVYERTNAPLSQCHVRAGLLKRQQPLRRLEVTGN